MSKPACRLFSLLVSSVAAIALFASCGVNTRAVAPTSPGGGGTASPQPTGHLVVTDSGNNRVLIYDAPFTTDENASIVLGQPNFTQNSPDQNSWWSSAGTLFGPSGLAMDAAGDIWVADTYDCRVVEFRAPFATDMTASVVIGQPQFSILVEWPACVSTGASGMMGPTSVAFDRSGDLWVSDMFAGRVTEYAPPFSNGMAATVSIGQTNLDDGYECDGVPFEEGHGPVPPRQPVTARILCTPSGIAFDTEGDLWVADGGNHRVLEFAPPFSTGMAATLELGQPASAAFNSGDSCNSASASCLTPTSLAFDTKGNLWIADFRNNRILEFTPPFSNGMAAGLVIGQKDFADGERQSTSANTLYGPTGVSLDGYGDLTVADGSNNRVLIYSPPFRNGVSATAVIGQPNSTSSKPNQSGKSCDSTVPAANTLCVPSSAVAF